MIPYSRHKTNLTDAIKVGWQVRFRTLTQGPEIEQFEADLASYVGAKYAVAVNSATSGLHLAALALDLPRNSTIATSPLSFVASANSILYSGHKPTFIDIDETTLNLDLRILSDMLSSQSEIRAVIPVHFAGLPCSMSELRKLALTHEFFIIEDAAHALGATYECGDKVGSCKYSDMTVLSFHPVKSITSGEGGAVTTNDEALYRKLIRLRSHGITKMDDQFTNNFLSQTSGETNPWYYEMISLGFNYRMTELQAVLGKSQLRKLNKFIRIRQSLVENYDEAFMSNRIISPTQLGHRKLSAHHLYPIRINFSKLQISKKEFMLNLRKRGIGTQVHYCPIPCQPFYQQHGYQIDTIPNALSYYHESLSIPLFPGLSERMQNKVISGIFREVETNLNTIHH